ncbi:hypothetical protein C4552_01165 [Candidatus Parcubacteria bacterium]|nr:MAG: hypothetical protein C4552_01165 [Candidatus Parcubacteria bacterium]
MDDLRLKLLDRMWQRWMQPRFERMPDREAAHTWTIQQLKLLQERRLLPFVRLLCQGPENNRPLLVGGATLKNPFVLPAGFDKHCEVLAALDALGVGAAVGGTIVPAAQPGNDGQRVFIYPHIRGAGNRYGFNSVGEHRASVNAAACELARIRASIGYSVGPNKDTPKDAKHVAADCLSAMRAFRALYRPGKDFFEINISSPNTAGLRDLFDEIEELLGRIREGSRSLFGQHVLLWLKIPPDGMTDAALMRIMSAMHLAQFSCLVSGNTTADTKLKATYGITDPGGVSGQPLFELANDVLARVAAFNSDGVDIVAVGGITRPPDVAAKRLIGWPHVRAFGVYTGLIFEGPSLIRRSLRAWERAA